MQKHLTASLAEYAASTSYNAIPADIRELAKLILLDEMASSAFGRRSLGGALAARYVMSAGGKEEALILGTNQRSSAPFAAMANGSAGHGEEVDGAHVIGGHPGATLVHAAVALAERERTSGEELINALVLGYDVAIRLVEACGGKFAMKERRHLYSDFLFSVGAAVSGCRLLKLETVKYRHAMALSTFQANALACLYQERRHISKSFCNGQFAYAGVSAALMAAAGMEGVEDVIETRDGLLDAWGIEGGEDAILRGLGSKWPIVGSNFKFINAGYPIHAAVEAGLGVVQENKIDLRTIASVVIGMPGKALRVVDSRDMHNICVQDMLCAAITRSGLSLRDSPFPAVLSDPVFSQLRRVTTAKVDPELDRTQPEGRGARVTVTTNTGDALSKLVEHPRGHSKRGGATWRDLEAKWRDGLPGADVGRMIALAQGLEDLKDVREFVDLFQVSG